MTRQDMLALIEERQAAINRRDAGALTALHAEEGIVESLMGGTVKGRAAIGEIYRAWFAAFPDVASILEEVVIDGARAVVVSTMTGTNLGGFLDLPPSNKPFRLAIAQVCTVRDGQIIHERRIYDFTGLLVQIGVLKARPA